MPCTVDDLWADAQQCPMRRYRGQVGPTIGCIGFREIPERYGPMQRPIALDERQV